MRTQWLARSTRVRLLALLLGVAAVGPAEGQAPAVEAPAPAAPAPQPQAPAAPLFAPNSAPLPATAQPAKGGRRHKHQRARKHLHRGQRAPDPF